MFDQGQFRPGMGLAEVYLIHKGADEEDTSSRSAQDVLWRERVGNRLWIETYALVGDFDDEITGCGLKGCVYQFV